MLEAWHVEGPAIIERVRREHPAAYLRLIASVLPRQIAIEAEPLEFRTDHAVTEPPRNEACAHFFQVGSKGGTFRRIEHGESSPSYGHAHDCRGGRQRQEVCRLHSRSVVLGRSLAQRARVALYRAASTCRAAEPRLAGSTTLD